MRGRAWRLVAAAMVGGGCTTATPEVTESPPGDPPCVAGRLTNRGVDGMQDLLLVSRDGASHRLEVGARSELPSLVGADVEVCGSTVAPGVLRVQRFDLLAIDGLAALLGTLERTDEGYRLTRHRGESLRLDWVPEGLRPATGERVWVQVSMRGDRRLVMRYGILP